MAGRKTNSAAEFDRDCFVLPHLLWVILIPPLEYIEFMAGFAPYDIPWYFGPLATFGEFMGTQHPVLSFRLCMFTIILHSTEAVISLILCRNRGFSVGATIKWILSAYVYGIFSVLKLLPLKPPTKTV
ncbi:transmembrane protein 254 [Aplysia californica]|uniref:Transmembrane protein 254 n=1 Tax=Aplysia californica TaxID=6500 RepID=A0ABM0K840_APLCA|nr:transmembrane protein 254 [Aplysia californica]